jgi:hypothetical protein
LGDLVYATRREDGWHVEAIDAQDDVGQWASLAISNDGQLSVSYYDAKDQDLRYARWGGRAWNTETVDAAGGRYTSLAIDSWGNPHIAYEGNKYAHFDGSTWHLEIVGRAGDSHVAIAVDSADRPHMMFRIPVTSTTQTDQGLKHASKESSGWIIEDVGSDLSAVGDGSLALDANDRVHVLSYTGHLTYLVRDSQGWRREELAISPASDVSLAVDSHGEPHACYYSSRPSYGLRHAYRDASGWHIQVVDGWGGAGRYTSTAIDSHDRPLVSYFHGVNHDLHFAARDGDAWEIRNAILESIGATGGYTSLVLDSTGAPFICFYNGATGDLQLAHCAGEDRPEPELQWQPVDLELRVTGALPCSGSANLAFELAAPASVRLAVYDLGGRRVKQLLLAPLPAGFHATPWDGLDDRGLRVPSGTYICSAEAGGARASTRVVLIR